MSIARHHAEWLSLTEVSGPFLSMPVLMQAFPQGLDAHNPELSKEMRLAFEEWENHRTDSSIHTAWIIYVLAQILEFPEDILKEGKSIPAGIEARMAVHGETLRPDKAIINPNGKPEKEKPALLVKVYDCEQNLEKPVIGKYWKASPSTRMMELLHASDVSLGLITNGEHWMLVYAPRGETTSFASWYASLWVEEQITFRAFCSLLSVRRVFGVEENETIEALYVQSSQDQQEVTEQLGFQVRKAVEVLIQSLDRIDKDSDRLLLDGISEKQLYDAALTIVMRLVFLFSAEERGLLLLGDPLYDQNYAVSTLRDHLRELADQHGEEILERRFDAWGRLLASFRAVHGGVEHLAMRLPPYGGNLFNPDRYPFLEGRKSDTNWREVPAEPLKIDNRTVLHLLEALQILQVKVPGGGPAEARRLSFRALDIEQIGHVYEGLLDHTAVRATGPILGLLGTKKKEPEIALSKLESLHSENLNALLEYLKKETGRTEKTLIKAISEEQIFDKQRLMIACSNKQELYERTAPYIGLLRDDTFGYPVVISSGSVFVTSGTERRSSGTHYTPRSLTEPIVKYTLEPLVYVGPAEGKPEEEWELKPTKEILDLKICDMAMGSGAFLVQACRYLSERLVEAYEDAERKHPGTFIITPDGELSNGSTQDRLIPSDPDERLTIARRYITDRCLYGVDKNPMAVEMAKLSLWLITLQKDRPFTFLDHALKCGDSLIGIHDIEQLRTFSMTKDQGHQGLILEFLESEVDKAVELRNKLETIPSNEYTQLIEKENLYSKSNQLTAKLRCAADMLVAAEFNSGGSNVKKNSARLDAHLSVVRYFHHESLNEFLKLVKNNLRGKRMFHWPLEYPEIFHKLRGFDCFIGNPPFLGGSRISEELGDEYNDYLISQNSSATKKSDLCAYFFVRASELTKKCGTCGLLATDRLPDTITRKAGLDVVAQNGGIFYRAISAFRWPGQSSTNVVIVWIFMGDWHSKIVLDSNIVPRISSALDDLTSSKPYELEKNSKICFQGVCPLGMGFVIDIEMMNFWIKRDTKLSDVVKPYFTGREINNSVNQSPTRAIIHFGERSEENAIQYTQAYSYIKNHVFPERRTKDASKYPRMVYEWWKFWHGRQGLFEAIKELDYMLIFARITKYIALVRIPSKWICSDKVIVCALSNWSSFGILQSSIFDCWARNQGSSRGDTFNFVVKSCFNTFPFPTKSSFEDFEQICEAYYNYRKMIMINQDEGLTKIYNRFHNPDCKDNEIAHLRKLQIDIDNFVTNLFDWHDLKLEHRFHDTKQGIRFTISEKNRRYILDRLLNLNHSRYNDEGKQRLNKNVKYTKKKNAKDYNNSLNLDMFS